MRCVDCRWFNKENEFCMKDGGSVFGATIDDECEYADNITVFDRITASPELLAHYLVRLTCFHHPDGSADLLFASSIAEGRWEDRAEAIAATVARLKEQAE